MFISHTLYNKQTNIINSTNYTNILFPKSTNHLHLRHCMYPLIILSYFLTLLLLLLLSVNPFREFLLS